MSHVINDLYLENAYESFHSSKNGFERVAVLKGLQESGLSNEVDHLKGAWYIERFEYLKENDIEEKDLMFDEEGEYYMDINESGAPGGDYQVDEVKIHLPKYLEVDYWVA